MTTTEKPPAAQNARIITSANEIDGTEVWLRARADDTDGPTARKAIFREMIEAGTAKETSLIDGFRIALGLESAAQKELRRAREERERFEAAQHEWDGMLVEINEGQQRLAAAAAQVAQVRNAITNCQQQLDEKIGRTTEQIPAVIMATELQKFTNVLPLMETAERSLVEKFWTRVAEISEHGKKLGVSKAVLKSVPTRMTSILPSLQHRSAGRKSGGS
jgi:chromosome segregation ATPase